MTYNTTFAFGINNFRLQHSISLGVDVRDSLSCHFNPPLLSNRLPFGRATFERTCSAPCRAPTTVRGCPARRAVPCPEPVSSPLSWPCSTGERLSGWSFPCTRPPPFLASICYVGFRAPSRYPTPRSLHRGVSAFGIHRRLRNTVNISVPQ